VREPTTSRWFAALLLLGLVIRLASLPLAGTGDLDVWKHWSYGATNGVSTMYGVGGHPPVRGIVHWGTRATTVDYPPATLYALGIVGRAYRAFDPSYEDGRALTVAIKSSILIADAALCWLLWLLIRRRSDEQTARVAALFYWLNPATMLDGGVLGYLDPWMGALILGALVTADAASPALCGILLALAVLTKLQSLFVAPAVLLVLGSRTRWRPRPLALASLSSAAAVGVLLAPFIRRGALPNVIQGVGAVFHHDMLSATAANLWWIVTWLLRASYAVRDLGAWAAWTMTVRILGISRLVALGFPNPRPIATAMAASVMVWAFWRARRGTLPLIVASGALAVHAYFVLAVQVHENHLYLALPLMAAAAAMLPRLRGPFYLLSGVFALDLFLFYGLGRGFPLPPRGFTVIDATVVLSFVNVGALVWHARRFAALDQPASPAAVDLNRRPSHV
jgi:hypothetical protein